MKASSGFLGLSALLFFASAAATIAWSSSMSSMGGMEMPGDWTMSMAWMRMPGQSWFGAAATFLGMWSVMMPAMMLPSLVPVLWRYRQAGGKRHHARTALIAAGYFFVWAALGAAIFPLGVWLAQAAMEWPTLAEAAPFAASGIVLAAGLLQFSGWKLRHLECCRAAPQHGPALPNDEAAAWRYGLRLGLHCTACCAGATAVLLVLGVMDWRAMAIVTAAITVERLAPHGRLAARGTGVLGLAAGIALTVQAAGIA